MSSLKIEEVVKRLPSNEYNISKTMREVGYAKSTSVSGQQYGRIRKAIEKAYNPEQIKRDILKAEKDFEKDKDNSNRSRMLELRAKILGLTKEQTQTSVSVFTGDMVKDLPPIDVSTSSTEG